MISGICESPLTMRAIIEWREALSDGQILLRDVIDLDATYGREPGAAVEGGGVPGVPGTPGVESSEEYGKEKETAEGTDGKEKETAEGTDDEDGKDESEEGREPQNRSDSDDEDLDEGTVSLAVMEETVRDDKPKSPRTAGGTKPAAFTRCAKKTLLGLTSR